MAPQNKKHPVGGAFVLARVDKKDATLKILKILGFAVIRKYQQQIITNAGKRVGQRTGRKLDSFPPVLSMPCGTIERHFATSEGYCIASPVSALWKPLVSRLFAPLNVHADRADVTQ